MTVQLPLPAGDDWRSWASALVAALQSDVASGTQVIRDTSGRIIVGPDGLFAFDPGSGDTLLSPTLVQINTQHLVDAAITTAKLRNLAVDTDKLADLAVLASKLADGSVVSTKLADGSVVFGKIAPDAVERANILDDAIDAAKIADGAVGTAALVAGAVTAAKTNLAAINATTGDLVANAVGSAQLQDAAVTLAKIAAGSIDSGKFVSGVEPISVVSTLPNPVGYTGPSTVFLTTDRKLYRYDSAVPEFTASVPTTDLDGEILATDISDGIVTTPKLAANAVTAAKIAVGTITANEIAGNTITAGQIAAGTITGTEIAADTIVAGNIAAGAIGVSELAAGSVIAGKIAANAITAAGAEIADATIVEAKIANAAVTNAKIANLAVTNAKINDLAANKITAGQIGAVLITLGEDRIELDGANAVIAIKDNQGVPVTRVRIGKLAAGATDYGIQIADAAGNIIVSENGLGTGVVDSAQIVDAAVGNAAIAAAAIGTAQIGNGVIITAHIGDAQITDAKIDTLTANKITAGTIGAFNIFLGDTSFLLDGGNRRLTITDTQGTPQERIRLGKLGAGATDYGVEILDSTGATILSSGRTFDSSLVNVASTTGVGNFATVNQITGANIATLIATAVIGNAYISDLSADKITAGTLTGRTIQTASSGRRVEISAANNRMFIYSAATGSDRIVANIGHGADSWTIAPFIVDIDGRSEGLQGIRSLVSSASALALSLSQENTSGDVAMFLAPTLGSDVAQLLLRRGTQTAQDIRIRQRVDKPNILEARSAGVTEEITGRVQSLAVPGYVKFPGGLIVQWGSNSISNSGTTITLPTSFTSSTSYVVQASTLNAATGVTVNVGVNRTSNSQFAADNSGAGAFTFFWFAIGF